MILLGERPSFQDTLQLVAQDLLVFLSLCRTCASGTSLYFAVIKLLLKQRKFALRVPLNSLAVSYSSDDSHIQMQAL